MLKSTLGVVVLTLTVSGCNTLRPEADTREIVMGDCLNGAILNQATFGGPVRCGPQSQPVFTEVTPAPES